MSAGDLLPRDDLVALATRAAELAGADDTRAEFGAYCAVAELYIDRANRLEIAAAMADRGEYRRRDEAVAAEYRALALDLLTHADGIRVAL